MIKCWLCGEGSLENKRFYSTPLERSGARYGREEPISASSEDVVTSNGASNFWIDCSDSPNPSRKRVTACDSTARQHLTPCDGEPQVPPRYNALLWCVQLSCGSSQV